MVLYIVEFVLGVLFVILGIGVSIGLHEIGHLVPAKRFGARVSKYMVGFGPTVWSFRRGETEYGIKLIPLGGYIAISGMMPPGKQGADYQPKSRLARWVNSARRNQAETDGTYDASKAFYRLSIWKRVVVMVGGPTMNLILGLLFTAIAISGIGMFQAGTKVEHILSCVKVQDTQDTCTAADPISPARKAGLLPGDVITKVNGQSISTFTPVQDMLVGNAKPLQIEFRRGSSLHAVTVRPVLAVRAAYDKLTLAPKLTKSGAPITEKRGVLGIALNWTRAPYGLDRTWGYSALALGQTAGLIVDLPHQLYSLAVDTFSGAKRNATGPVSIVGISNIAGDVAANNQIDLMGKLSTGFMMLASLNFALFVFNLVPLLPLDGGHVLSALYEGVKRGIYRLARKPDPGPVDTAMAVPFTMVMWAVLMGVSLLVMFADFVNPIKLG